MRFNHFIMNLPAIAIEFLDAFQGVYLNENNANINEQDFEMPWIHVHCFSKSLKPQEELLERVQKALDCDLISISDIDFHCKLLKLVILFNFRGKESGTNKGNVLFIVSITQRCRFWFKKV